MRETRGLQVGRCSSRGQRGTRRAHGSHTAVATEPPGPAKSPPPPSPSVSGQRAESSHTPFGWCPASPLTPPFGPFWKVGARGQPAPKGQGPPAERSCSVKSCGVGPSQRTFCFSEPAGQRPSSEGPLKGRAGGCPPKRPRSQCGSHKMSQQRLLNPTSTGNRPDSDIWPPGPDLVLMPWVTSDESPNLSGPRFFLGKLQEKIIVFLPLRHPTRKGSRNDGGSSQRLDKRWGLPKVRDGPINPKPSDLPFATNTRAHTHARTRAPACLPSDSSDVASLVGLSDTRARRRGPRLVAPRARPQAW